MAVGPMRPPEGMGVHSTHSNLSLVRQYSTSTPSRPCDDDLKHCDGFELRQHPRRVDANFVGFNWSDVALSDRALGPSLLNDDGVRGLKTPRSEVRPEPHAPIGDLGSSSRLNVDTA